MYYYTGKQIEKTNRVIPQIVEEIEDLLNQHGYVSEKLPHSNDIIIDPVEDGCPILISIRIRQMRVRK